MTTGTTGSKTVTDIPGRGQAFFWDYKSWTGTDSAVALRPKVDEKVRYRSITVTERVEGHTVVRTQTVPLRYWDRWDSQGIKDLAEYRSNHPYSMEFDFSVCGLLDVNSYIASGPYAGLLDHSFHGTIPSAGALPAAPPDPWSSDDDSKLLHKLEERVQGSDFNLASFLGAEGYDTLHFLASTVTKVSRAINAVKRGNVQRSLDILRNASTGSRWKNVRRNKSTRERLDRQLDIYKDAVKNLLLDPKRKGRKDPPWYAVTANQWLEFHLAAEPLLGDVKAAAEQLAHRLDLPQKKAYSVKRERETTIDAKASYGFRWAQNVRTTRKRIKYIVSEPPNVFRLAGLLNPEIVLWNALPLSFVFDWFLPIGDWLENRAISQKLVGEFVISTKSSHLAKGLFWNQDPKAFYRDVVSVGANYRHYGSFSRVITTTLPVPLPKLHPLGAFKSWQRAATAVSLIVGTSERKFRM